MTGVQTCALPIYELAQTLREVQATGLRVRGLMVMAPEPMDADTPQMGEGHLDEDASGGRILQVFMDTARRAHDLGLSELSMGMSGDYPLAVRAGATLIRVGRSLFS